MSRGQEQTKSSSHSEIVVVRDGLVGRQEGLTHSYRESKQQTKSRVLNIIFI